ncbi:MAG: 4Fe-4S binding protein [Desulfobacterales bacterium]
MNDASVYGRLADWLITTFRAQPGVKSPELMEILYFQYTPEEARLALKMGPEGGKIDELIEKTGTRKDKLLSLIESMEKKGTVYREPGREDPLYKPIGMEALGIIETASWGDNSTPFKKRLNELWHKFRPIYVNEGIAELGKTGMLWCHVDVLPEDATPEENLFEQIRAVHDQGVSIAVSGCPCRIIDKHGVDSDASCDCIVECCFSFGDMASWAVENHWARPVTLDECFDIIRKCHEKGQVNTGGPNLIVCNCCKHACINFFAMKFGKDHIYFNNHFYAEADPEKCVSCGTCAERCFVDAIRLDPVAVMDTEKCLGCGACASGCPENAVRMIRKSEEAIAKLDAELMNGLVTAFSKSAPNWNFELP